MKETIYAKLKSPSILLIPLLFLFACESPDEVFEDLQSEERVEVVPTTYNNSGATIPNEYLVVLKSSEKPQALPSMIAGRRLQIEQPSLVDGQHHKSAPVNGSYPFLSKYGIGAEDIKEELSGPFDLLFLNIDDETAQKLANDPNVELVEQNKVVALNFTPLIRTPFVPSNEGNGSNGVTSYGVDRVGGSVNFASRSDKDSKWAWVLDTGIDLDHPDLDVERSYSKDCTRSRYSYDDKHGHGTHVAGIIGAKDNNWGTRGVAAGATLVSVKVLDDSGEGSTWTVVKGLFHIYRYAFDSDIVNISLGGVSSSMVEYGIGILGHLGTNIVVASGNDGVDCANVSPANINAPNVRTVGSINWNDSFSSYSNYGSAVDYLAPGDGILSTYINGQYAYMSGTSMAAPHVTGMLLVTGGQDRYNGQAWARNRYIGISSHR